MKWVSFDFLLRQFFFYVCLKRKRIKGSVAGRNKQKKNPKKAPGHGDDPKKTDKENKRRLLKSFGVVVGRSVPSGRCQGHYQFIGRSFGTKSKKRNRMLFRFFDFDQSIRTMSLWDSKSRTTKTLHWQETTKKRKNEKKTVR